MNKNFNVERCMGEDGMVSFFIAMNPPTATAQMKKVRVVGGRPVFYEPPRVREAHGLLLRCLLPYAPVVPMDGAVQLSVAWLFPKGRSHRDGQWRTTRPDTDNLQKLLKDCMTQAGFWKDDAQVVREVVEKRWARVPGIEIEITGLEDG